jgi:hypothetical protein
MTDTQDQPLWRVMEDCEVFMVVRGALRRRLTAILIRAVADWLKKRQVNEVGRDLASLDDVIDWLKEQAIKAEAGQ